MFLFVIKWLVHLNTRKQIRTDVSSYWDESLVGWSDRRLWKDSVKLKDDVGIQRGSSAVCLEVYDEKNKRTKSTSGSILPVSRMKKTLDEWVGPK